jgi:energy-coupling factor transporter ATP-binding protein EcfA2
MGEQPLLVVDRLAFRYRRAVEPALEDISVEVRPGEVLLVAGPSGSGKSTLVRAMNGLIPHTYHGDLAGSVLLDGRSVTDLTLRDVAREVGTVLQDPARQIVASTVLGELAFGPENLGVPRNEIGERIADVTARTRIGHLLERQTDQLSGGERQLVAVAAVLMARPRLLLVDEPLANLDPATAHRLLELVGELRREGTAVVIVEHRVEDVLELEPDSVLELHAGLQTYLGGIAGFLDVADPIELKLPYPVVEARARAGRLPAPPSPPSGRSTPSPTDEDRPPRLAFRGVWAGYGDLPVLRGLELTLAPRRWVAILGPNASGKTTLLKAAMGLVRPSRGEVLVDGGSIAGRSVAQLAGTFGYVFQNPGQMLFERTVADELWFGPRNLGRPEDDRPSLVADVLRRVGLDRVDGIGDRPPLSLSFGQQKRLAIAVALALQPRTLLLDEPSAGQDHRSAGQFMREVRSIEGLEGIYFVTHDVDLALANADEVLLLRDGRVAAHGPPSSVASDHELWRSCNLRVTSLMEANARWAHRTGRFLGAEALAGLVAGELIGGEQKEDARELRA